MEGIFNLKDFNQQLQKIEKNKDGRIYGILLYTSMDHMYHYVHKYYHTLDSMAKPSCGLLTATDTYYSKTSEEVNERKTELLKEEPELRELLRTRKSSDTYTSYDLAYYLKITPDKFPCILFFKNPEEMEMICYTLRIDFSKTDGESQLTNLFREVFSAIWIEDETIVKEKQEELRWNKLKQFLEKKRRKKNNPSY